MTQFNQTALLKRQDVTKMTWQRLALDSLSAGQVRLDLNVFSLTTNNVTYAVMGEGMLGYWDFFPHIQDLSYGRLPVWGFGVVSESLCDNIDVGQKIYGYFPLAQSLVVEPTRLNERGFLDKSAPRSQKSQVYNQYHFTHADPSYEADFEKEASVFRPLYGTGWWLSDLIAQTHTYGSVLLSSASSKTAICTSYELKKQGLALVGLTSKRNLGYVQKLGLYDQVLSYEALDELKLDGPICVIDYLGRRSLIEQIDAQFGVNITNSYLVGAADWSEKAQKSGSEAPYSWQGPKPQFFFAPSHIEKRMQEDRGLMAKLLVDQKAFCAQSGRFCQIETMTGPDEMAHGWAELIASHTPPSQALVGRW